MFTRSVEAEIYRHIETDRILLIVGARQVGKTTIMKQAQKVLRERWEQTFFFTLEREEYLESFNQDPENIFTWIGKDGAKKYVFIDEIQYLKNPTNFLKYLYDEYRGNLKLIVSGSSSFYIDRDFHDSLAGRKTLVEMHTLDFPEFLDFRGRSDLSSLFSVSSSYPKIHEKDLLPLYHEYMVYGWYPDVVLADSQEEKRERLDELLLSYVKKDIIDAGIEHRDKYFYLLKVLASQVGNLLNMHELANTLNMSASTVENYIYTMRKSFHIATITPFFENIRKELTKMPKVYFYDTWLRNACLNNFESFEERVDKWPLLENLVFKNFLAKHPVERIKFWRTQNKNEVDFVVDEKWAYEVKANINAFEAKKYSLFVENYPNIPLVCLDFVESMKLIGK